MMEVRHDGEQMRISDGEPATRQDALNDVT